MRARTSPSSGATQRISTTATTSGPRWATCARWSRPAWGRTTSGGTGLTVGQLESFVLNHRAALEHFDGAIARRARPRHLADNTNAIPAVPYIAKRAADHRFVIVNERHHASSDRLLTMSLLKPLYEQGFRYLAAEGVRHGDAPGDSRLPRLEHGLLRPRCRVRGDDSPSDRLGLRGGRLRARGRAVARRGDERPANTGLLAGPQPHRTDDRRATKQARSLCTAAMSTPTRAARIGGHRWLTTCVKLPESIR